MLRSLLLATCCILIHVAAAGYHIIGGEIYYAFLVKNPDGKYKYEITLKLYRNADFSCGDIQGCLDRFEDPVPINVYTSTGTRVRDAILMYIKELHPVRDTLRNPCLAARTQNLEVAIYRTTIDLPTISGGYYVAYQRCCRGEKLANINDSEHEGSTFYCMIPGTESRPTNKSAYFAKDVAIVICANMPLYYDYSASDPDGDSLTYTLCSALTGGSNRNEAASANPPPYRNTVSYRTPYSGSNPMGGNPQVSIDNNGILHGVPLNEGQFVVSVCVSEFDRRSGALIGTHHKDILLTVFQCNTKITAGFPPALQNCLPEPDMSVLMPNTSNAGYTSTYYWNFGDGTDTLMMDKTVFKHTFPDTGRYVVKLVVNRGLTCADSTTGIVSNYPGLKGDFEVNGYCKGELIQFDDQSSYTYGNITARRWDMGLTGDSVISRAVGEHVNFTYEHGGVYSVTLVLYTDKSCTASVTKDITVYEIFPFAGNDTILAKGQLLPLHATGGEFYAWSPTDGLSNPAIGDPVVQWDNDITYTLRVSNAQGCVGYDTMSIKYYTGPEIYVPNAFSPNADGKNDLFRFIPVGITAYKYFRIFNRWGQLIYSSTDFRQGWDGTFNGMPAKLDTYIWILEGKDFNGQTILKKGTVTLLK